MEDELRAIVEENRPACLAVGAESRLEELLREHNDVPNRAFSSRNLKRGPTNHRLLAERADEFRSLEGDLESQPFQGRRDGRPNVLIAAKSRDQVDLCCRSRLINPLGDQPVEVNRDVRDRVPCLPDKR